jgi:predicted Zn-dependent protease with MMP-like domain
VDRKQFEGLVAEALASIPRRFKRAMQNIAIVVEDEPSAELLEEMEIEPPDTLLGLYQGTPLTERGWGHGNALPDRVLIFQGPHARTSRNDTGGGTRSRQGAGCRSSASGLGNISSSPRGSTR